MSCISCGSELLVPGVVKKNGAVVLSCVCGHWYRQQLNEAEALDLLAYRESVGVEVTEAAA